MDLVGSSTARTRGGIRRLNNANAVFDLIDHQTFTTQATGAAWDSYVISGPEFESIGPALVDLILHARGEGVVTNFSYRVRLEIKFVDGSWGDPAAGANVLLGPVTSSGSYVISTIFTDRTKVGMSSRLVLDIQNSAAAVQVSGRLTMSAAVRLYCGS